MSRYNENKQLVDQMLAVPFLTTEEAQGMQLATLVDISKSLAAIADELANIKTEMKKPNRRS